MLFIVSEPTEMIVPEMPLTGSYSGKLGSTAQAAIEITSTIAADKTRVTTRFN